MEIAKLILQYLQAFLSWPVATFVIAITAVLIFKPDIRSLMARIAKIRFPGGSELSTSQAERSADEPTESPKPAVPQAEADKPLPLPPEVKFSTEQLQAVRQLYLAERANAYLWEYRYLNYYLADTTQRVLDWFATVNLPISRSLFDNVWGPSIPDVKERQAIITALQGHYLIALNGDLMSLTPKGEEYRAWRGPLAPRPAA